MWSWWQVRGWACPDDHTPIRPGFYPALDAVRGFAAVSVLVYHVIEFFQWRSFPAIPYLSTWFRRGWMAVDLFFVISGFVITRSALNVLDRNHADYAREFTRKRLTRIVPLHYLTCLTYSLFVAPFLLFEDSFWTNVISHLTFTQNWFWHTMSAMNSPNWSLGVEMQFYLLILLTAPWFRRWHPLTVLTVCVGTAWCWRAWVFAQTHGLVLDGVKLTWYGLGQVPGALDEFGFGIALAMILNRDHDGRLHRFLHRTRFLWPLAAAAVFALATQIHARDAAFWGNRGLVIYWKTLIGASFILVVISACALNSRWFLRLLAPWRYLGTISFGIYLWHILVLLSLKPLLRDDPARACLWILGLSILLGALSWHLFEKPILQRYGSCKTGNENIRPREAAEPGQDASRPVFRTA